MATGELACTYAALLLHDHVTAEKDVNIGENSQFEH
ncbi:60S acidic ribosomal-like protein [Arabidopsis thaliana]|uniref:60S acidic ribosomal protein-like protein n=1 Tax=Arabidopsis thaliana TaxID=3702 RepID=Q1PEH0_ARATH|nr:60S acidic ribosomal-like protein [Arabidopsis thaliana]ABE66002.1 60S acidic ribosomal protein-like protein [Arabidopsis thaliana]AEE78546.1 60S acidic ribosomal-like protein [Arabidopsis thaliana]|eukprot:NP_190515.2 60S acidic ribosomal-like protein [Arabidopsis thaliana]